MAFQQIREKQHKDDSGLYYLERGLFELPIEDRFLASAQRILDAGSGEEVNDKFLRHHQIPAFLNFSDYLTDLATSPKDASISPFCRIVLPPRTGKTVVAGKIIALTGLCSTFIVPTKALVIQTLEELRSQNPGIPIGLYYGEKKQPVNNGVNITTYMTLQRHFFSGKLPDVIRRSALVFLDEAHHAMTDLRVQTIHKAFDDRAVRIALTATPDYNEHKQLHQFFPELIHEIELFDAFELGLLAPARMWIIEVDADASNVRFVAGDYEQEILGRLMSTSPFFKAVQVFRYSKRNLRVPALISCASKQQAYDLWTYLKKHKPRGRPRPGLILGDTSEKERKSLLSDFECGHIDTLIQVNVLIEGWNAPRCKLLLDLAPSLSRVRATQKYFRVMTRYKDKEARIVVILPKHLARQPVLPVDLILKPGEKYLCGDLLKPADKHTPTTGNSIEKTFQTPVKSVKVKTHVIACASLAKPDLDPDNLDQIRQVLASCPDFSLSLPFGRIGFKRLFFNHPLFVGTGDTLLRFIGIPDEQNAYLTLMFKLFPENMGNLITKRNGFFEDEQWRNCENDFKYIKHAALEPNDNGGKPRGPFISTLNALCGGIKEVATPEEAILIREQVGHVVKLMEELDDRQRQILIHRLGLFGKPDLTWNEIGLKLGVSRERIRQIFFKALRKLRKKYLYRVRDDNPITKAVFEYPDLFEIISKK